jgi:hypothetical protein
LSLAGQAEILLAVIGRVSAIATGPDAETRLRQMHEYARWEASVAFPRMDPDAFLAERRRALAQGTRGEADRA